MTLRTRLLGLVLGLGVLPGLLLVGAGLALRQSMAATRAAEDLDAHLDARTEALERRLVVERGRVGHALSHGSNRRLDLDLPLPAWLGQQGAIRSALEERPGHVLRISGVGADGETWELGRRGPQRPVAPVPEQARTTWTPTGAVLAVPLHRPLQEVEAVVVELSALALLRTLETRGASTTTWVIGEGHFVAHTDPARVGLSAADRPTGSDGLTVRGEREHPATGWVLGGAVDLAPYVRGLEREAREAVGVLLLLGGLLGLGVLGATRRFGLQLTELAGAVRGLAAGRDLPDLDLADGDLRAVADGLAEARDALVARGALEVLERREGGPAGPPVLFDVAEAAGEVLDRLDSDDLVVERELAPWAVRGCRERVLGLVAALVANAVEAQPEGGLVRVVVEPGCIDVVDAGPGVDDVEEALRPFTSTRPGRLGLGLPRALRAARELGWTLTLGPGPGGGTKASVRVDTASAG